MNTATQAQVKAQATTLKDDKAFGNALKKAREGVATSFALIQDCILYGLTKYQTHSADTSYLSRAMDLCVNLPGTNPAQVKAYIQELANVTYRAASDGTKKFGKTGKGPATVTMPEEGYNWWDQKSEAIIVRPDMMDPIAELRKLFEKFTKKELEGKIPAERLQVFHETREQLAPVLHMEPLAKEKLFSKPVEAEEQAAATA